MRKKPPHGGKAGKTARLQSLDGHGKPLKPPRALRTLNLDNARSLAGALKTVAERVAADPEFSVMLAVNPVLALEHYGVVLAPEMRDHVLHTLQHPAGVRQRRDVLTASLTETLGTRPRPDDEAWLADLVFKQFKLAPLDTTNLEPAYSPALNAEILKRLQSLRPARTNRYPGVRRAAIKSHLTVRPWRESVRRLDLETPAPMCPQVRQAPDRLSLEQLWFYKDQHPLVRDVLELGVILRSGFRAQTPDSFRRIAEGKKPDAFRVWIRSIRFKDRPR